MKKINVQQAGGYRFETETIDFLTQAYSIFNVLGEIAGNKTILKGCEVVGNEVTDGFVYVNGEVFRFKGGIKTATVRIREVATSLEFKDGSTKDVFFDRFVEFGTATDAMPWSDFRRYQPHQYIHKEIKFIGATITAQDLPPNWYIANGQNGTDNLVDMFIKGSSSTVGKVGTSNQRTLTPANMPKHKHTMSFRYSGAERDNQIKFLQPSGWNDNTYSNDTGGNSSGTTGNVNVDTSETGSSSPTPINIEPVHYKAIVIQYIKPN